MVRINRNGNAGSTGTRWKYKNAVFISWFSPIFRSHSDDNSFLLLSTGLIFFCRLLQVSRNLPKEPKEKRFTFRLHVADLSWMPVSF